MCKAARMLLYEWCTLTNRMYGCTNILEYFLSEVKEQGICDYVSVLTCVCTLHDVTHISYIHSTYTYGWEAHYFWTIGALVSHVFCSFFPQKYFHLFSVLWPNWNDQIPPLSFLNRLSLTVLWKIVYYYIWILFSSAENFPERKKHHIKPRIIGTDLIQVIKNRI